MMGKVPGKTLKLISALSYKAPKPTLVRIGDYKICGYDKESGDFCERPKEEEVEIYVNEKERRIKQRRRDARSRMQQWGLESDEVKTYVNGKLHIVIMLFYIH